MVRVRNALIRDTSARLIASSSAISMIQMPRICWAASLLTDLGQFVGEPLFAREHLQRARLLGALRSFEDQHVVGFDAGPHDASHRRDHPSRAEGSVERRVSSAPR